MQQSVRDFFTTFSTPFEGILDFMYLDVKGLVTTGMGNLIDSPTQAQQLPFFFRDDSSHFATADEIAEDWQRVKDRQDLRLRGGGVFRDVALLRIDRPTIDALVDRTLDSAENTLKTGTPEFADFDNWPADAQLGLLSMAWAMGAAFAQAGRFPNFRAACAAQDFDRAAQESHMNETGNPGLAPRNRANMILFTNAARVMDGSAPDPQLEILQFPQILTEGIPPV
jgi:hypothetical protein